MAGEMGLLIYLLALRKYLSHFNASAELADKLSALEPSVELEDRDSCCVSQAGDAIRLDSFPFTRVTWLRCEVLF